MKIGFIGLGNVGAPLAANLLRAGHALTVNDLERGAANDLLAAGAEWADSPRALAAGAEAVITSLPSPAAVRSVMEGEDGVLAGLGAGGLPALGEAANRFGSLSGCLLWSTSPWSVWVAPAMSRSRPCRTGGDGDPAAGQLELRPGFRHGAKGSGWSGFVASHTDLVCMKQRMPSTPFSRP